LRPVSSLPAVWLPALVKRRLLCHCTVLASRLFLALLLVCCLASGSASTYFDGVVFDAVRGLWVSLLVFVLPPFGRRFLSLASRLLSCLFSLAWARSSSCFAYVFCALSLAPWCCMCALLMSYYFERSVFLPYWRAFRVFVSSRSRADLSCLGLPFSRLVACFSLRLYCSLAASLVPSGLCSP